MWNNSIFLIILSGLIGLVIQYFIIKTAVKTAIIEATAALEEDRVASPKKPSGNRASPDSITTSPSRRLPAFSAKTSPVIIGAATVLILSAVAVTVAVILALR